MDPRSIQAVLVTHEHSDHARGAVAAASRWGWQVFATAGTKGASLELSEFGATTLMANMAPKDDFILPMRATCPSSMSNKPAKRMSAPAQPT